MDVTLTDGKIYMSANGELMKAFNIKDGSALARLCAEGIEPFIITGRSSEIVKRRCEELGIKELHQGVSDKATCLKDICEKRGISKNDIGFVSRK